MAARGSLQHRLTAERAVRRADARDRAALAAQGFGTSPALSICVAEAGEKIAGAVSFAPRPFESKNLGLATLHLDELTVSNHDILPAFLRGSLALLSEDGGKLVTSRRPAGDIEIVAALEAAGFKEIERLVTLSRSLEPGAVAMPEGVAAATDEDADGCAEVARRAFRLDRFHVDPKIDNAAADRLKAQWAANSVRGRADRVFVTRDGSRVTGFNACMLRGNEAVIDLIGVAPDWQGRGLGRALTMAAVAHYGGRATRLLVGTQITNNASLSLYESAGLKTFATAITLHAHLS